MGGFYLPVLKKFAYHLPYVKFSPKMVAVPQESKRF
jgi:hypothetical protein